MGISVPKLEIKYLLQTDFFFLLYEHKYQARQWYVMRLRYCTFSFQDYSKVILKNTLVDFYLKNF